MFIIRENRVWIVRNEKKKGQIIEGAGADKKGEREVRRSRPFSMSGSGILKTHFE